MIVGYLRSCGTYNGQKRGLPDVGESDKPYVGDGFKLEFNMLFFGLFAVRSESRSLPAAVGVFYVAFSAVSALLDNLALSDFPKISHKLSRFDVADDRSHRHENRKVLALLSVTVSRRAVLAVFGSVMPLEIKIVERVELVRRDENNAPALSAVASVRTSAAYVFLRVKGHDAVSSVARLDVNPDFIRKHCLFSRLFFLHFRVLPQTVLPSSENVGDL